MHIDEEVAAEVAGFLWLHNLPVRSHCCGEKGFNDAVVSYHRHESCQGDLDAIVPQTLAPAESL
jgi:predicted amidohydrolase YtcJ